jgi:hypothetical protein
MSPEPSCHSARGGNGGKQPFATLCPDVYSADKVALRGICFNGRFSSSNKCKPVYQTFTLLIGLSTFQLPISLSNGQGRNLGINSGGSQLQKACCTGWTRDAPVGPYQTPDQVLTF